MPCIKEKYIMYSIKYTYELLEKLINKRSELKYLIKFRKINQTRFYY